MIKLHRELVLAARAMLAGARYRPLWLGGTAALSVAKILENMEIGHNVMHGQWDWMNDPDINSQTWDWDTASPADAWRHSHNYEHHTFTNIRGKDRDLGYEIMRIDPHQKWHPVYLLQPLYNLVLMGFFEWGVALHDLNFDAIRAGEKSKGQVNGELKAIGVKARKQVVKDYVAFPLLSAAARGARLGAGRIVARRAEVLRGARTSRRRSRRTSREHRAQLLGLLDHLLRPLPRPDLHLQPGRSRGRDPRRLVRPPAARRRQHRGRPALPPASGNLSFQVEHHLFPDMPSSRYAEIAPRVRRSAAATACRTTPARSASSSAPSTARSCAWPSRGQGRPKPGPYRPE